MFLRTHQEWSLNSEAGVSLEHREVWHQIKPNQPQKTAKKGEGKTGIRQRLCGCQDLIELNYYLAACSPEVRNSWGNKGKKDLELGSHLENQQRRHWGVSLRMEWWFVVPLGMAEGGAKSAVAESEVRAGNKQTCIGKWPSPEFLSLSPQTMASLDLFPFLCPSPTSCTLTPLSPAVTNPPSPWTQISPAASLDYPSRKC